MVVCSNRTYVQYNRCLFTVQHQSRRECDDDTSYAFSFAQKHLTNGRKEQIIVISSSETKQQRGTRSSNSSLCLVISGSDVSVHPYQSDKEPNPLYSLTIFGINIPTHINSRTHPRIINISIMSLRSLTTVPRIFRQQTMLQSTAALPPKAHIPVSKNMRSHEATNIPLKHSLT